MSNLSNLEPKEVFKWFYEINQIPRSSGNEKEVSDYLVKFAKDRNFEVYQDEVLNVIIKKPGTSGYENSETVIIQGHMDMVCVKADDSNHDFDKDPIEMIVDGDLLRANKTTLGADNGIAVAFGLAVLDSTDLPHPPIELLVTTNEETGMDGAMALKPDHLTGTRLLNIDTEEEGDFFVSCSGGANLDMSFNIEKVSAKENGYEIIVSDLKGGHSGSEIHLQRGNALKIVSRLLNRVKNSIVLSSFDGGIKHNAIPSYARATFVTNEFEKIEGELSSLISEIKEEYRVEEPDLKIYVSPTTVNETYTEKLSKDIIEFFMILPDGVQYISKDIEGLVQTSLNNAVLAEKDGKLVLTTSVRSAALSSIREILDVLQTISSRFGVETKEYASYPAWQFEAESKLRDAAMKVYKELTGKDAGIASIHAGLECGLLKGILPNTDMISYGPNIRDAHSPLENVSISSVERMWNFTKKLLEELK